MTEYCFWIGLHRSVSYNPHQPFPPCVSQHIHILLSAAFGRCWLCSFPNAFLPDVHACWGLGFPVRRVGEETLSTLSPRARWIGGCS